MRKIKSILIASLFILSLFFIVFNVSQVHAAGSTYYVSTTGSDTAGDGSIGNPYKTIQKAVNVSVAGDTIYVRGGNYNKVVEMKASGTAGNPITLSGYPGELAVINGAGISLSSGYGLITLSSSPWTVGRKYITIQNLALENSTAEGIGTIFSQASPCNNITIKNCSFYNIWYRALSFWQELATAPAICDVLIDHCTFDLLEASDHVSNECNTFSGVHRLVIRYCNFTRLHHTGVSLSNHTQDVFMHNNRINNTYCRADGLNYEMGIYIDGRSAIGTPCTRINISNNMIWGNQEGIRIANEIVGSRVDNVTIWNNIINITYPAYGHCISIRKEAGKNVWDVLIKFNTLYNSANATHVYSVIHTNMLTIQNTFHNVTYANNIISGKSTYLVYSYIDSDDPELHLYNNLYWRSDGATRTAYEDMYDYFEPSAVKASPQFVYLPTYNFHLNSTSPAIDAAASNQTATTDYDGNLRPMGLGYDIGAYEVGPSSIIITSDSDFNISNGVRYGSGTTASPYMISNWTVYNVSISGTTKNFTIKDCTIIHHVLISGLSVSSNLLWSNVIMDGAGHIPLSYIYLTHTLTTFTNSKFYNLSYSYMKNG